MKLIGCLLMLNVFMMGCATSNTIPVSEAGIVNPMDTSGVTIFLLERDIPPTIKKLGVVSIPFQLTTFNINRIDGIVKAKLNESCQKIGANGAYRINDGSYYPKIISYLVFRYDK